MAANSERIIGLEPDGSVPVTIVSGGGTGGTASSFGNTFPPTGTAAGFIDDNGDMAGANLDASGNLLVNVAAGSGSNPAAGATGSAVPSSADYQGVNVAGTLRGATAVNPTGTVYAQQTDLTSVDGTTVATGHGLAAGTIRVELPTDGTGKIATVTAVTAITNALPAGSNVIGHVIADTGSTTAVTGNVTVVQGTASSLKAQVTGAGTAGSADTGVLSIQGIASMTPVAISAASLPLPTGAATDAALKPALTVTALQVTASGDTSLISSGTHKLHRIEMSNSSASAAVTAGIKVPSVNGGNAFSKKYLPALGGLGVYTFPGGYIQVTSEAVSVNLSGAGQVEVTAYYE